MAIYDMTGKQIVMITGGKQDAGKYIYTIDADKYNMSAGVYFLNAVVGNRSAEEKIIRIK
jgi:hypothetical protein